MMIGSWQDRYTGSIPHWMSDVGMSDRPVTMVLKRFSDGNRAQVFTSDGAKLLHEGAAVNRFFPGAFRPLFPNGWADVAEREGFELPKKTEQK